MPPPPTQTTSTPASTSRRIVGSSTIERGSGEATTRRWPPASSTSVHPARGGQARGRLAVVDRADRLRGALERRVAGVHHHLGQQRRDARVAQLVDQLLLEQVADHALGLGAEHVERIRLDPLVGLALERQQAHLGPVSVGDDDVVLGRQRGDRLDRGADVAALGGHVRGLAAAEQRVASERRDDQHGEVLPASRRAGS